ncbi:restriction endonuclease subunit S [Rhizobium sp. C1]|nr:restriction endonuclease subunit S [Rhizobium sp. C1]
MDALGTWTGGGTPSKANPAFWSGGSIPWVSPKDMKVDVIGDTEDRITEAAVDNSSAKYVPQGTILMVMRSGILRHTFPVAVTDRTVTLNQDLRALTPREGVNPTFVARYLKLANKRVLEDCSKDGTTVNSIEVSALERLPVPLAPLPEQRRIVERIDALFAEIADGEVALEAARKGLETFRRALLKAAVTGELTRDWRETHKPAETGHDLLARIRAERAATPAKGRGKSAVATPTLDTSNLPDLPDGWVWATLDEVASSVRNGTSAAPRANQNQFQILRISAVRPMWVDETQIRYLSEDQAVDAKDAIVTTGDLLFTRYNGSTDLVGVGALYSGVPRYYPDKIIRVRLDPAIQDHAGFFELAVNTGSSRKHIASNIKTTAGQQGLSGESLKLTPIPIPPPNEASEILKRVKQAMGSFSDCQTLLQGQAADASRLRQAILKSAFEGTLVPQDPADEPAAKMLERLRQAVPKANPRRRGRGKAGHGG